MGASGETSAANSDSPLGLIVQGEELADSASLALLVLALSSTWLTSRWYRGQQQAGKKRGACRP